MPLHSDVSSYTGVFRLASPSDPSRRVIKRNRQVVSCVPCRKRKLKCDRQQPCAACVRRHDVGACKFVGSGSGSGRARGSGPTSPAPQRQMQTKLAMLENLIQGLVSQGETIRTSTGEMDSTTHSRSACSGGTSPVQAPAAAPTPADGEHLSRDGNEVRFVGSTNYQAVLECIQDLQGFVNATQDPEPAAATPTRQHEQEQVGLGDLASETEGLVTIPVVQKSLPSKAECDGFLTFYFQQIDMIPVVIHAGHFQRTYEKFWQHPDDTSFLWLSLLFSLLSTSLFQQASLSPGSGVDSNLFDPEIRNTVTGFSSMAYRCLLAGDHLRGRPYSVEATLIYGMHLILQKRDTEPLCWHAIETATRLAQRMGYHREIPKVTRNSSEPRISAFDAEMRRRAWAYLEYFDVIHSFQHGVPPIIRGDDVDTELPSNLRDEDFDENSDGLPKARSTLEYTPMLVIIHGCRQVKILRHVVQQALAVKPPSYGDVRILDGKLRSLHEDVAPSLRYRLVRDSGFADAPDVIMRRFVCEITHLKTMCILHRRYLTVEGDIYETSRQACREASMRLLDLQAEFDEHSGFGARLHKKRFLFTNPTGYHDFLLAAMCICLDLLVAPKNHGPQEHERKLKALGKARNIWRKTSQRSKEAARATKILDEILCKVSQPTMEVSAARLPSITRELHVTSAAEATGSVSSKEKVVDTAVLRNLETPMHQTSWSALNGSVPRKSEASKSYSVEWDFAWLDNLGNRQDRTLKGAWDDLLTTGVDWNYVDSLLLYREHAAGTAAMPGPHNERSFDSRIASREGWPYISYKEPGRDEADASTNYRTWGRTGITLGGFGPSSGDSTFP